MCKKNEIEIFNYLEDLAGCETVDKSKFAFYILENLLKKCGIEESVEKARSPCTKMIFIGILFDTENMTISIDQNRLDEI